MKGIVFTEFLEFVEDQMGPDMVDTIIDDCELSTGGAYTGQGTTMSINGIPWGIGVPGMGRSIYAGVNIKF